MTKRLGTASLLFVTLTVSSCGQFGPFSKRNSSADRHLASAAAEQLVTGSQQSFNEEVDDQLRTLHQYYVIGHSQLEKFDQSIKDTELTKLYETDVYKTLIVIRELTEEIEDSLIEAQDEITGHFSSPNSTDDRILALGKMLQLYKKIMDFSEASLSQRSSMENLTTKLQSALRNVSWPKEKRFESQLQEFSIKSLQLKKLSSSPLGTDLEKKYKEDFNKLKGLSEFEIQQKNIEHLSLLLDIQNDDPSPKIYPSSGKAGNITGNEFPAKVWALTYDDGPGKASTLEILEHLKKRDLKASFFQLTQQVKANASVSKAIKEAGMEIASHSWSHQQLTKVGPSALEKEISLATQEIEKFYDVDVKYFRLPYGAGVSTASIREKISDNKLVHVFWNIDTLDWMSQTPDKIVERTINLMKKTSKDAGIILMHDIHARTATASAKVMDHLLKDNRRVCTVGEIVDQINQGVPEVCSKK